MPPKHFGQVLCTATLYSVASPAAGPAQLRVTDAPVPEDGAANQPWAPGLGSMPIIIGEPSARLRKSGWKRELALTSRRIGREDPPNRCSRQIQVTGYLSFADSRAEEFPDRNGVDARGRRAAKPFAFQSSFCQSGANALAQQVVFELSEDGE